MKSNVKITFCDIKNPLEIEGKKFYKNTFIDEDGLSGTFYSNKVMKFGDEAIVRLEFDGGKFKFKLCK